MNEKLYTINQVAEVLGVHHKTIRKFITEGKLAANKAGKQWRISDQDLSSFLEMNNDRVESKEEYICDTAKDKSLDVRSKVKVSTVVDISDIDKNQYMRISSLLIAVMNSRDSRTQQATLNMKYNEKSNCLRILLWGQIKFMEEMLDLIATLIE